MLEPTVKPQTPKKDEVKTVKLDLKTRISIMAAFIYGAFGEISVEEAMAKAIEIENLADLKVRSMKRNNPVFPKR